MRYFSSILLLFLLKIVVYSQGQNPPGILWKSIQTKHFDIIFPDNINNEAQRVANTLEWVYYYDSKSLKIKPKPISILLYNQSNKSNAYAALAPRRMGWYLTPPQSITSVGSTEWLQTLAIHEYRHVVQYAKNRQHFTKFMSYLFGDVGQIMMHWSIPDWFFEGDAITMETALSQSGRGRMPSFSMYIRTYQLSGVKFTYDQAYLGSYKQYYPSHYHLGYPLTAYGRVNFGADFWDKVLERTSRISFWPYAFSNSIKKYSGLNTKKFYNNSINEFERTWKEQESKIELTEARIINTKRKRNWTNYFNPQFDSQGNIITGKESLDKIPAFYKIHPDGKEEKLKNTDAGMFNLNSDKILWSRTIPDKRWGEKAFTDIMVFDIKTNKEQRLTIKEKYLSPALSPDGKLIAVVEYNQLQECSLCIIDVLSGKKINSFRLPDNDYIRTPVWSGDGRQIVFTHSRYNGTALSVLNLQDGSVKTIENANWENMGKPVFYKNYLLYNSDYSGISNIYATDMLNGKRYQITSRPFGAYNADISPNQEKLVFQDYTKNGFDIAEIDLQPENWKKIEDVEKTESKYYQPLIEQEGNTIINEVIIPDSVYTVKKYRKGKDLINIHSWGVYPYVPDLEVSITTNNYLNTLGASAGYLYNTNEKTNTGFISINYARFFPVFGLYTSYGEREESGILPNDERFTDSWIEFNSSASISVPFNFSQGIYNTGLLIRAGMGYTYTRDREIPSPTRKPNGSFASYYGGASYSHTQQYAWRDFAPKWGQLLSLNYYTVASFSEKQGYLFSGQAGFYFPGIFAQHSLKLGGAYEKQIKYDPNNWDNIYYFSSRIGFPRGYNNDTKDEFYKLTADYQLPLWYPDISIGPLVYIKRIRAGAFIDYAEGFIGGESSEYQSIGGSILFEFKLLRINYPFEVGVQFAHRLTDGENQVSLLILGLPF